MSPEEIVARNLGELWIDNGVIRGAIPAARAALQALREAGWRVVPEEATDHMLAVVKPEPTHLYPDRDADYQIRMKAAVMADRLSVLSMWRQLLAAAPGVGEG